MRSAMPQERMGNHWWCVQDAGKKKCGPKQRQCSMVRAQGEFKHKLAAVAPEMEQLSPSKGVGTVFVVNRVPLAPTKFPHNKR